MARILKRHFANAITFSRIAGTAAIFFFVPFTDEFGKYITLWLFLSVSLTDTLDGTVSRSRFGEKTKLGKILDPMADKLLTLTYLALIEMRQIPTWPVALLIGRDIIVSAIRINAAARGIDVAAKWSGKIKTVFTLTFGFILFARAPALQAGLQGSDTVFDPLMDIIVTFSNLFSLHIIQAGCFILALLAVYSCIDYAIQFSRVSQEPKII